jgi:hypothetical protein
MVELRDLERRIGILEDIEAIKKVKAQYWRSQDRKQPDELAQCFSVDALIDFDIEGKLQGVDEIIKRYRDSLYQEHIVTLHQGHGPEIDILSDTTAEAIWGLLFYRINTRKNTILRVGGFYEDEYVKEDGKWRIKVTRFTTLFTERLTREG